MDYGGSSSERKRSDDSRKDRGSSSGTKRTVEEKDGHDRSARNGSQPGEDERQAKVRSQPVNTVCSSDYADLNTPLALVASETERGQGDGVGGRGDLSDELRVSLLASQSHALRFASISCVCYIDCASLRKSGVSHNQGVQMEMTVGR
jgi:hypothetical protein